MNLRIPILLSALTLAAPLAAQFDDPQVKIAEIATEIAEELQEIDRLLLQTGKKVSGRESVEGMKRNVKRIDELLKQTTKSQRVAVKRIDELIKELEKLGGS